jgi:hypothetical protein
MRRAADFEAEAPLPPRRRARLFPPGEPAWQEATAPEERAPPRRAPPRRVDSHEDAEEARRVRQFHHRTYLHLRAALQRTNDVMAAGQARKATCVFPSRRQTKALVDCGAKSRKLRTPKKILHSAGERGASRSERPAVLPGLRRLRAASRRADRAHRPLRARLAQAPGLLLGPGSGRI